MEIQEGIETDKPFALRDERAFNIVCNGQHTPPKRVRSRSQFCLYSKQIQDSSCSKHGSFKESRSVQEKENKVREHVQQVLRLENQKRRRENAAL